MHGLTILTPKQILAEKISLREKQKKVLLRKQQAAARQDRDEGSAEHQANGGGERVVLTPDMAVALLEHNTLNRPLSDAHVRRIAKQIIEGKWKFNGDTIKVADTGDVLDGQHRLWAIAEANTPVETLVVYGIARDAFSTIDTIRRSRSGGDVLALNGATRYRPTISAALQWLMRWQRKSLVAFRDPNNRIENSDIEESWATHPRILDAVERAMKLRGITNPSILAFFYYVLYSKNKELADRMMDTLENPAGVGVEDPFFKLREYFLADHFKRKEPLYTIALMIKAANAAHLDKKVSVLRWNNQGSHAEKFPVLDVTA